MVVSLLMMTFNNQVLSQLASIQSQLATIHANQLRQNTTLTQLGANMADDFTANTQALMDLKTEVGMLGTEMDTLLADLLAAQAGGPSNQPAIDAATAAIQAQIDALKAVGTRDMPPVPVPPPAP